jgi:hypothetical protein
LSVSRTASADAQRFTSNDDLRPTTYQLIWSGRRGSNPRPTAWKAVTLPLSYSRLRGSLLPLHSPLRRASPPSSAYFLFVETARFARHHLPTPRRRAKARLAAKPAGPPKPEQPLSCHGPRGFGGEGRVRTSVATWAADLQSAAIDRSATSPYTSVAQRIQVSGIRNPFPIPESFVVCLWNPCVRCFPEEAGFPHSMELAEGFEPPTG